MYEKSKQTEREREREETHRERESRRRRQREREREKERESQREWEWERGCQRVGKWYLEPIFIFSFLFFSHHNPSYLILSCLILSYLITSHTTRTLPLHVPLPLPPPLPLPLHQQCALLLAYFLTRDSPITGYNTWEPSTFTLTISLYSGTLNMNQ